MVQIKFTGAADAAVSAVGGGFEDKTHYSIGVGRKLSNNLAMAFHTERKMAVAL